MNDRDRKLGTARRLGKGIVAVGVAGSVGVAGLVGLSAAQHSARPVSPSAPATPRGTTGTASAGTRQVVPRAGDDGPESDDGFSFPSHRNVPAPPSLQQGGGGVPHGTTTGS